MPHLSTVEFPLTNFKSLKLPRTELHLKFDKFVAVSFQSVSSGSFDFRRDAALEHVQN